jgi:hypothetical protein
MTASDQVVRRAEHLHDVEVLLLACAHDTAAPPPPHPAHPRVLSGPETYSVSRIRIRVAESNSGGPEKIAGRPNPRGGVRAGRAQRGPAEMIRDVRVGP